MLSGRTSLGIAQTVFYVPAVPLALYLFWRNGIKRRPKMAWWPLIPLTLSTFSKFQKQSIVSNKAVVRLVGGIITIVLEQRPSTGLYIAAIVLLSVGAIPLIVATLGQMRIILMDNYSDNSRSTWIVKGLRLAFIAAVVLLVSGGSLSKDISRLLSLIGYIVFAAVLAFLISMELYFMTKRSSLTPSSQKVLKAALLAAPFLVLRTVYGILGVCFENAKYNVWSPIFGSVYAFAFMCLLTEYIAITIYFWLGFSIPADRGFGDSRLGEEGYLLK